MPKPPPDPTNRWAEVPEAAEFGRRLFYDPRFSGAGDVSCATCHQPDRAWTDGRSLALGAAQTSRHAPSLHNAAHQRWLFWDGRADSLWAQALGPLEDEREHAGSRLQYAHTIYGDPRLRGNYERIFGALPDLSDAARFPAEGRPVGDPDHPHQRAWDAMRSEDRDAVTEVFVRMGKAIAAFERRMVTAQAPFDVFVEGVRVGDIEKQAALEPTARDGLRLFLGEARCHLCHDGPLFSDLEFHVTGAPPLDPSLPEDLGRAAGISALAEDDFNGTGRWSDDPGGQARYKVEMLPDPEGWRSAFKTPSLRNVAKTAPYMHQGQLASLEEVLDFYSTLEGADLSDAREQLLEPLDLGEEQRVALMAFLRSLTDYALPLDQLPPDDLADPR